MKEKTLICLTGLTGAGKTTVKELFSLYGCVKTFYTKDLHALILDNRSEEIDKMEVSKVLNGKNAFIKKIMDFIKENSNSAQVIVLDSLRSTDEWDYIRSLNFKSTSLIHVTCDENIRKQRLFKRDHCKEEDIEKRDAIDMGNIQSSHFNMGKLFADADMKIDTNTSLEQLKKQIEALLKSLAPVPLKIKSAHRPYINDKTKKLGE